MIAVSRPRSCLTALGAALVTSALAGCDAAPAPLPFEDIEPAVSVAPPRRPGTTYYLLHVGAKCFVYTEQADERATRKEELCPRDLRDGERIRLMGHVCMREGGGPERDMPVRCPKGLLFLEYSDRLDAGLVPGPETTSQPSASSSAGRH